MKDPKVSFVVPCYNLDAYLAECVRSILSQTFSDFEVLIMDDCSRDQTPQVASGFSDPRVKYYRNESNLGHLRNYNRGIGLASGEYIWLISADDNLRCSYVLEHFVRALDRSPKAGYVFCPVMDVGDHGSKLGTYSFHGAVDKIFDGREFLKRLLYGNLVPSASGMVRKDCYDRLGAFPLDMPYAGDWYLWSLFALHYEVCYLAEPMVNYRLHDTSMTARFLDRDMRVCVADHLEVSWRIKQKANEMGDEEMERACSYALAQHYADHLLSKPYRGKAYTMSFEEFAVSLSQKAASGSEERWIRARACARLGDLHYWNKNWALARHSYRRALESDPWIAPIWIKYVLLAAGRLGICLREWALAFRRFVTHRVV